MRAPHENDVIYHEELQTAYLLKRHHLIKSISDVVCVLDHPERRGSMRRSLSRRRAACLYQPAVFWL